MEQTIDLGDLFKIIKKYLWVFILLPLIFLGAALAVSLFIITPKYEATTQLLVNEKPTDNLQMAQQIQSNLKLVNTYTEIIKSPRILDEVEKNIDQVYSADEIREMLSVNNQAESQVLNINVTSEAPEISNVLANTISEVFSDEVVDIMSVDNVSILSVAEGDAKQVEPRTPINAVIGLFIGFILALALVFLKEMTDTRIRTEEHVEEILELPILGTIAKEK
ncbi:Wzz/FepE/Etk N-terminal domain-containing protein [Phocicoccus pinnipedialis]|uniref:Capsular polysaccharide type 8 biosynthesis protein cap8A n=1 Tax=Phocicoccus pinnipedialis TaxID=110845 RepID=A0A6V7R3J1_9BACL|nr:Wzz/FepE/Etk N-terminal domain-containing protein [Jeotgalicoccus pinnipedialis]MBP1938803.1 capsular polysaccharide biosynthesis protein [Jeotgalicoccus pinnipedialis]CAD2071598.1 Capsular polysaccharide type 8 biosynthesis protein cap8A [Jeotgalicoccus pinnipedialis]